MFGSASGTHRQKESFKAKVESTKAKVESTAHKILISVLETLVTRY
jgi:hypothetical protein